jgi:hypothetical protein
MAASESQKSETFSGAGATAMTDSPGRFVWYELTTTDTAAAKAFYSKVLGWGTHAIATPGTDYTLFTVAGVPVSGLMSVPEHARRMGARPTWLGYVGVDDVDVTAERIKSNGGAVHVPPTDVPNISRFSIVADPQMATFALFKWLNPGQQRSVEAGQPGGVGWHELFAADGPKVFDFYGMLFGWQKVDAGVETDDAYRLFSAAGQTIGGMFTKPAAVSEPFWLFYFTVGDIDAAAERVKAGGGAILEGPVEMPGGNRVVRGTDPQGAMFALTGMRRDKSPGYFKPVASSGSASIRFQLHKSAR